MIHLSERPHGIWVLTGLSVFISKPDYNVTWTELLLVFRLKSFWKTHKHYLIIHKTKMYKCECVVKTIAVYAYFTGGECSLSSGCT